MTELTGYRPEQTPQEAEPIRYVFTPEHRPHLTFDIQAAAEQQGRPIGSDNPAEVNRAIEDAENALREEKQEAAARTAEHVATDAELAQAIDWNAAALEATREYAEFNGL